MLENLIDSDFLTQFNNPSSDFRGTPFWAWNTKLENKLIISEIDYFKAMGMGGFYIHVRTGLKTPYLSKEFMDAVQLAVHQAHSENLQVWLYDEDRWPSGYAGGEVTKNHSYRSRYLLITRYKQYTKKYEKIIDSCAPTHPHGNGKFLVAYNIKISPDGYLKEFSLCGEEEYSDENQEVWYVYEEIAEDNPWFNNQAYVDTLNPDAINRFIECTHEKYSSRFSQYFGSVIKGIFTDEPQFARKKSFGEYNTITDIMVPYSVGFMESFEEKYNINFLAHLPELIWDLPDNKLSRFRYCYHRYVSERFNKSFSQKIGDWCRSHKLSFVGHMMEEPTLESQTRAIGEVMSSLRHFDHPGIDILCDRREFTTAKQAQSIVHQYDKERMAAELYGVTNWDFDFRNHKLQGDWLAALGVTSRIHHLAWMSMEGESKRDFPASIGFQSPWFKQYSIIEDHFSRLNTALLRGRPIVNIGIIHPIETYWLSFNTSGKGNVYRDELDEKFQFLCSFLLENLLDFDYIAESLIPELCPHGAVGSMNYETILIADCLTIRRSTLDFLKILLSQGKEIFFIGRIPKYVDLYELSDVEDLVRNNENCKFIPFEKKAILEVLEQYRFLDIRYLGEKKLKKPNHKKEWAGKRSLDFIYQLRKEESKLWLFIAHSKKTVNQDLVNGDHLQISVEGHYTVVEFNTLRGTHTLLETSYSDSKTYIEYTLYEHDSLLLLCIPLENCPFHNQVVIEKENVDKSIVCNDIFSVPIRLVPQEKNVVLFDIAEYSLDNQEMQSREEILRIDEILRSACGIKSRRTLREQPWVAERSSSKEKHELKLKFEFFADSEFEQILFATENLENVRIFLNESSVRKDVIRNYVDPAIHCLALPTIKKGLNRIIVEQQFAESIGLEPCYLLGDFLVELEGTMPHIQPYKEYRYSWGDIVNQGFPFYGGNIWYRFRYRLPAGKYEIQISKYRGALLQVYINQSEVGHIIFSPYTLEFTIKRDDIYEFSILVYGNRFNTFGALHDCDDLEVYFDQSAWRTTNESWSYEYQCKKTGILKAPVIRKIDIKENI